MINRSHLSKLAFLENPKDVFSQSSSMTAHLKQAFQDQFRLEIISTALGFLQIKNIKPIAQKIHQKSFLEKGIIRDIYLCRDKTKFLFARSFLPLSSLRGYWRCLIALQRPLGEVLFHQNAKVKRECIGFQEIHYPNYYLGRFLIFQLPTGPILVTEWMRAEMTDAENSKGM